MFHSHGMLQLGKKYLGERAMDQDAFMPQNRLVARGNATTFPLAWEEIVSAMQGAAGKQPGQVLLPKVVLS